MTTQSSLPAASVSFPTTRPPSPPSPPQTPSSSARASSVAHASSSSAVNNPQDANAIATASSAQGANLPDSSDSSSSVSKNEADATFDNLEIVDASLKGKLAVLRVGSEPTENNLLSVFVGLKNRTPHPLPLEVQTIYKDKLGNQINGGSWVPLTLKPHEETEYRSASISSDAADFLVRIRRAVPTGDN